MYEEDPDDCIFVTENKGDGTSSALSLGQLNGDPNENVHIVYENVTPYPEVLIVKEVPIIRISDMEANPVAESTVDEAHFWLNGYVNKQNCRIWSEANPQVYIETPLHPEKLTVWCALWAGGIIGPYFKNDEGHNVTVNGDRYRAMITNFFIPELNNHDVQELWFQQDSATCHTARATIDLLKDMFGDRLISRFGPVNWPPRSCDLTPLDYILWGYVKSLVYADKPQTLDHLEDIHSAIADIRPQMLEKVIENWTSRLDYIRASCGSHMPEIIFKMSEPIASISSIPPVNEKDQNKTKTSEATGSTGTTIVCGICLETAQEVVSSNRMIMSTLCGHIFCCLCITKALEESIFCPKCRKRVNPRKVHRIYV
ncbi:transposase [Trichonephila clavipes]|nr:transposase [Trichonephila clavipes]